MAVGATRPFIYILIAHLRDSERYARLCRVPVNQRAIERFPYWRHTNTEPHFPFGERGSHTTAT
jgi:hypothetical protein